MNFAAFKRANPFPEIWKRQAAVKGVYLKARESTTSKAQFAAYPGVMQYMNYRVQNPDIALSGYSGNRGLAANVDMLYDLQPCNR